MAHRRGDAKTFVEEASKQKPGDTKGSHGVAERGVQEIEGRIRAILTSFGERLGHRVNAKERSIAFIPEYAAYL